MDKQKNMKWVLVDFDGTLAELSVDWNNVKSKLHDFFSKHGIKASSGPLVFQIENGLKQLGNSNKFRKEVHKILKKEENIRLNKSKEVQGAKEMISMLSKKGYRIAVYSSNDQSTLQKALAMHGFKVDLIFGRKEESFMKPTKNSIKELLTVLPKERIAAVIGDSWADEEVGKNLNIPFFLVNKNNFSEQLMKISEKL